MITYTWWFPINVISAMQSFCGHLWSSISRGCRGQTLIAVRLILSYTLSRLPSTYGVFLRAVHSNTHQWCNVMWPSSHKPTVSGEYVFSNALKFILPLYISCPEQYREWLTQPVFIIWSNFHSFFQFGLSEEIRATSFQRGEILRSNPGQFCCEVMSQASKSPCPATQLYLLR